jgi:uncharacterized DUF497 family protein
MIWFEWDPAKARTNRRKHGVSFDDAMHVFDDPYAVFEQDPVTDAGEPRWGRSVCQEEWSWGGDEAIRLISARRATRKERSRYDETRTQDVG